MATMAIRHPVQEYATWRKVYDEVEDLRAKHNYTGDRVLRDAEDASTLLVLHEFASIDEARAFAGDPGLKQAMENAGVAGPPRIEFYDEVE